MSAARASTSRIADRACSARLRRTTAHPLARYTALPRTHLAATASGSSAQQPGRSTQPSRLRKPSVSGARHSVRQAIRVLCCARVYVCVQLCFSCVSDGDAVYGSCAATCASAALGTAGLTANNSLAQQAYVFLAFLAGEVSGTHTHTHTDTHTHTHTDTHTETHAHTHAHIPARAHFPSPFVSKQRRKMCVKPVRDLSCVCVCVCVCVYRCPPTQLSQQTQVCYHPVMCSHGLHGRDSNHVRRRH